MLDGRVHTRLKVLSGPFPMLLVGIIWLFSLETIHSVGAH